MHAAKEQFRYLIMWDQIIFFSAITRNRRAVQWRYRTIYDFSIEMLITTPLFPIVPTIAQKSYERSARYVNSFVSSEVQNVEICMQGNPISARHNLLATSGEH